MESVKGKIRYGDYALFDGSDTENVNYTHNCSEFDIPFDFIVTPETYSLQWHQDHE